MEELIKKNSSGNIDNDNDSIKIIKKISPSNIQDYSKEYLISLINKEKTFFDNIDINALIKKYLILYQKILLII